MSTIIVELYDALKEAGASEEKARAASNAIFEEQLATKSDITVLKTKLDMIKWMVSGVGFGVVLLVIRSFWGG